MTDKFLVGYVTQAPEDNSFMEWINVKNKFNDLDISNRYDREINGACKNEKSL